MVKKNAEEVERASPKTVMTTVSVFSPILVLTKPCAVMKRTLTIEIEHGEVKDQNFSNLLFTRQNKVPLIWLSYWW